MSICFDKNSSSSTTLDIVDGVLSDARRLASPFFNARPTEGVVDLLVIHAMTVPAGNLMDSRSIDALFLGDLLHADDADLSDLSGLKVSAHCLIDRLGKVTQYVNFNDRAWHAGVSVFEQRENCNDYSIGIELIGTNDVDFTALQYDALIKLTKSIQIAYPRINVDRIVGHQDIAPERKWDPGNYFDWIRYKEGLLI